MRIIAGSAGGHRLNTLSGSQTRPTADRVKEAIFSTLGPKLPGSQVLDAFAGSAALGLEALSRGAASAWFFEKNRAAADVCAANIAALALPGARLIRGDVLKLLPRLGADRPPFDLVFADPPYASNLLTLLLNLLADSTMLAPEAIVVAETASRGELILPPAWQALRKSVYGDTAVTYCRMIGRENI